VDGAVEYIGRGDQQVKLRGFRIELGEIEEALRGCAGVREAAVAVKTEGGDARLVGYVVGEKELAQGELRVELQRRLPEYMVPSAIMRLESLPLSANGKLDRKALPTPDAEPGFTSSYTAPRNETENVLARIWAEVLHRKDIGIHENFFEMGGHSLSATLATARARATLKIDLPLRALYESPTVARLAEWIISQTRGDWAYESLPVITHDAVNHYAEFPLAAIQQAYWIGRRQGFELGGTSAHLYLEFDAREVNVNRLEQAVQMLVRRHDMLRAVIGADGLQRILPSVPPYQISVLDLTNCGAAEAQFQIEKIRGEMSHYVFDPNVWPLFDIRMEQLSGGLARLHVGIDVLILDAGSIGILTRELARLYRDPGADMVPLDISFRDYVLAEEQLKSSVLYRRSREFWLQRIESLPPSPQLPLLGRETPAGAQFTRHRGTIGADSWQKLQQRAAACGLTPSSLLLAAYARVLAWWSKSQHFTLNLTTFNRLPMHPQVSSLIGDFTSLTLVPVEWTADSFQANALAIQRSLVEGLDHSHFHGVEVLRELARRRGDRLSAAMPVVLTSTLALNTADTKFDAPFQVELVSGITQTPQTYLDNQLSEKDGELVLNWDVIEEMFPAGLMGEMFVAYGGLLERLAQEERAWSEEGGMVRAPAVAMKKIREANETAAPQPRGLLQDGFFEQARKQGERAAVLTAREQVSYRELAACATHYARELRQRGVRRNELVAVVMEKGWEQVAAVLAIVEAGGAYLPIEAGLPEERRRLLLELGEVRMVLTQGRWKREMEWPSAVEVLEVRRSTGEEGREGRESREEEGREWERLEGQAQPEDLAYVIFTSGSTGVPKGVMMEHRATLNTIVDMNRRFGVTEEDRILGLSSLSFDLSVYDIFGILAVGGGLVLAEAGSERDPGAWLEVGRQHGVTIWNSVPALLEMAVEYAGGRGEEWPKSLRQALLSGDWIPVTLPEKAWALGPKMKLDSLGGATEAAIWSIHYPIEGEVEEGARSIPYGRAMANQRFYVLDEGGEERPVWATGQLHIGGVGLARGYWKDEERTKEQFWVHGRTGERLYKTGDLGRWRPDGNIEFLGREDAQVKVQGHRIELGEIEAALRRHEAVKEAVVTVLNSASGKRLAAYVVLQPGMEMSSAQMREHLGRRLPHYMVPATLTVLESLPLSGNGKVDRKALQGMQGVEPAANTAEPRDPMEEIISSTCAQLLGLESVGIHHNLFSLGADSVTAVRLVGRLEEAFGVKLSLRAFFEDSTVAGLAQSIMRDRRVVSSGDPRIDLADTSSGPLLSSAQERLWFLCHSSPEIPFYNLPLALRLTGELNTEALGASLNALVPRHEALQSSFSAVRGKASLRIEAQAQLPLNFVDCSGLSAVEVLRSIQEEGRRPFDLTHAPLARATLFRAGEREHVLVLTVHHIISDAWSIETLVIDLIRLYAAAIQRRDVQWPAAARQYSAYAQWERHCLEAGIFETELEYWRTQLAGAVPLELATLQPRQASHANAFPGARQTFALPANLIQELKRISREEGATLFMTLLAAFSILLHRDSGQNDIVVATSVSSRVSAGFEDTVGCFLNTLLLRVRLTPVLSFRDLLASVREVTSKAYAHQSAPFEEVVRRALPSRDLSHALMSRCVFGLRNARIHGAQIPGLEIETIAPERGWTKFEIELQTVLREDGITGFLDYNRDLFSAEVISRMLASFETLLTRIVADPATSVFALAEAVPRSLKGSQMEIKTTSARKSLRDTRVRPITGSPESLVRESELHPGYALPLLIEPNTHGVDLASWLSAAAGRVHTVLRKHGAVLFRNFGINSVEAFESAVTAFTPELMKYTERSTPRSLVTGNIYTSTEYPADQRIPMHNENSYSHKWPRKLWFYCALPAQQGGETPLADSRLVYQRMDPAIRTRFEEKQVMYLRNFREGLGLSWQESFQTDDPAEVERHCASVGMAWEWLSATHLRTRHVRPATARHPESGEPVWFNQANLFQMSSAAPDLQAAMGRLFSEDDLPRGACYGDGSRIEPEALRAINEAYQSATILIPWRQGDVVLVDNMLVAHGRESYQGARKVVVALAEPFSSSPQN
jgi:amino acid adenylation domain-containing protein